MLDFWLGLGSGALVAAAVFGAGWAYFRRELRRRRSGVTSDASLSRAEPSSNDPAKGSHSLSTAGEVAATGPGAGAPVGSPLGPLEPEAPTDPTTRGTPPTVEHGGPTRLSQRVLLHIAREGAGGISATVSHQLCQQGIAEALGVTQGALSGVLRRLVAGGALISEKAHVVGHERRLNVYLLAPRGREIVRRLWKEFPAAPTSRTRRDGDALNRTDESRGRLAGASPRTE